MNNVNPAIHPLKIGLFPIFISKYNTDESRIAFSEKRSFVFTGLWISAFVSFPEIDLKLERAAAKMNHGYQFSHGLNFKKILQARSFQRWREFIQEVNKEIERRPISVHSHWCVIETPLSFCGFCDRLENHSNIDAELDMIREARFFLSNNHGARMLQDVTSK